MDTFASIAENSDPFGSWWPYIIACLVGIAMTIRTVIGGQRCPTTNLIDRQVVIVTGASGGIGFELCKALCGRSAHVIMACKDMKKAERAAKIIKREVKCSIDIDSNIETRYLDLRSFDNVRRFVKDIARDFESVDILINNAGIIFHPNEKTADGFEIHLQVNYLAPVLLTHLMLPLLKKSPYGRIINISAHAHIAANMSLDDPLNIGTWATTFHPRDAFSHSKLAIILFTSHLSRIIQGTNITVNCCTPGLVRGTDHLRRSPLMSALCVKVITFPWMWLFMKNPAEGAQCALYLATDQKLQTTTGKYFNDCEIVAPSELAQDNKLAENLFKETLKVLKMTEFDIEDS